MDVLGQNSESEYMLSFSFQVRVVRRSELSSGVLCDCREPRCGWRGEDLRWLGPEVDHVLILLTISGWDILYRFVLSLDLEMNFGFVFYLCNRIFRFE
ncbi:hypothetical protein LINPERHAP2_LOCUS22769 [Linum perenne]